MGILSPRAALCCNAPASLAGQVLRGDGALLKRAGLQWAACAIVASEQTALITDSQRAVRKLMNGDRTTDEVNPVAGRGQL
jgi:hypothetical protein